jgi:hypothetical protein
MLTTTNKTLTIRGFTLIETLLYLAIASSIILGVSLCLVLVLQSRIKYQAITEVEQQGIFAMQVITDALRNADVINTPFPGATSSQLSINIPASPNNPVVFYESGGILKETVGNGSPIDLVSPSVTVSKIEFADFPGGFGPGAVRVKLTLNYNNISTRNEYAYQADFYNFISLRR